ncbi:MAG: nitric oxide reductase activation protein [Firmicutes bacterium]|nr:nitric oxide reductase activation protein [Bacillota bacterium]
MEEYELELENRIKNLMWTVSGNYSLDFKPDLAAFARSKYGALYDGIKQGAFARYFDREAFSMYLVKKLYCHAMEGPLLSIAQLCIEFAVSSRMIKEREGVGEIRRKACEDILEKEFHRLQENEAGRLKLAMLREILNGRGPAPIRQKRWMNLLWNLEQTEDTMEVIRTADILYNEVMDPYFERQHGTLEQVLAVTLEDLAEFSWKEFLEEEALESTFETYLDKITEQMTNLDAMESSKKEQDKEEQEQEKTDRRILVVDEKALERMYSYVERNYGRTFLTEAEEKRINYLMCRGIHSDCSLYFTRGILKEPVLRNYQYEYARKQKDKNLYEYYDNHRTVKNNIRILTEMLRKTLVMRDETEEVLSDRGKIVPARLWRIGRTNEARFFTRELYQDSSRFVVDILLDASGSQRPRQGQVAIQAYILSEALSNVGIPHRVMSFCTFWDYTILHEFRDYDAERKENSNIFEYVTSSNNRDGLAIKAVGGGLLDREEEHKILIVLSDGKPYDVILNRPNARNPKPYEGNYAVSDTGFEVRRLRSQGVCVLGVFAGEEKDLAAEKKIFGKDFAYIRKISGFSPVVGRYLMKQLEKEI